MTGVVYKSFKIIGFRNPIYLGTGTIKGGPETNPDSGVFVLTVPASRRVLLRESRNPRHIIDDKFSGDDGSIMFGYLRNSEYVLEAWDYQKVYENVIAGPARPYYIFDLENDPEAGQTVDLPVSKIIWAVVLDSNDSELTVTTHYSVTVNTGQVTFSTPLNLDGFEGPYKIFYAHEFEE